MDFLINQEFMANPKFTPFTLVYEAETTKLSPKTRWQGTQQLTFLLIPHKRH